MPSLVKGRVPGRDMLKECARRDSPARCAPADLSRAIAGSPASGAAPVGRREALAKMGPAVSLH